MAGGVEQAHLLGVEVPEVDGEAEDNGLLHPRPCRHHPVQPDQLV